jgi:hypothetical protein
MPKTPFNIPPYYIFGYAPVEFFDTVEVFAPFRTTSTVSIEGPLTVSGTAQFTNTVDFEGPVTFTDTVAVTDTNFCILNTEHPTAVLKLTANTIPEDTTYIVDIPYTDDPLAAVAVVSDTASGVATYITVPVSGATSGYYIYKRDAVTVVLSFLGFSGTSTLNVAALTNSFIPENLRPLQDRSALVWGTNASLDQPIRCTISTTGTVLFTLTNSGFFTGSGSCSVRPFSVDWIIHL